MGLPVRRAVSGCIIGDVRDDNAVPENLDVVNRSPIARPAGKIERQLIRRRVGRIDIAPDICSVIVVVDGIIVELNELIG